MFHSFSSCAFVRFSVFTSTYVCKWSSLILWSPLTFFLSQKSRNSSIFFFFLPSLSLHCLLRPRITAQGKSREHVEAKLIFFCCKLWPPGHVVRNDHGGLAWTGQKVLHVQILVGYNGHRKVAKKMRRTKKDTFELVDK